MGVQVSDAKFCLVLGSFFEQVIVSQVVVIGVVGGLNIGVLKEGRRRMESRDQVMSLCAPLCTQITPN